MFADSLGIERRGKAGPAGAAFIFFGTVEQFGAATGAEIAAFVFVVIKCASEGALGACFAQHMILLGGQLGFPLGVGENLLFHDTNMGPAGGGINIVYASASNPCSSGDQAQRAGKPGYQDRKSTRLNSSH